MTKTKIIVQKNVKHFKKKTIYEYYNKLLDTYEFNKNDLILSMQDEIIFKKNVQIKTMIRIGQELLKVGRLLDSSLYIRFELDLLILSEYCRLQHILYLDTLSLFDLK